MKTVVSHDQPAIASEIEQLRLLESTVFAIAPSESDPEHNVRAVISEGKTRLIVPFADSDGDTFMRFGATELAGPGVAPDSPAHRDSRPANILNVHHIIRGSLTGRFALLPDELHGDNMDLLKTFEKLPPDYDIEMVEAVAGLTLCFLGGVSTHIFESTSTNRLSAIQSFGLNRRIYS
jgi:hypothetical protein